MEPQTNTSNKTILELSKRYQGIITSYLRKNNYVFTVSEPERNNGKVRVEIQSLDPQDAFYLGVNTQVQLVDGEILA